MGPLRFKKFLDVAVLAEVKEILAQLRALIATEEYIPRTLPGELWTLFLMMLGEADHAKNPEPILDAAWDIAERLRLMFGPTA